MSKCALPAKREGHQNGTILQTQKGSSVSRNGRKILSAFLLDTMSRHLPPPRCRRKKKKRRTYFGTGQKEISPKSRWDDTAGKSSRERQAPAPVCRSQSAAPVMQGSHIPDPLPDGSQDTGGAFRSRVQRPGVRHRSIGAGRIRPMWLRTDLVQVKRDRHTGRP